MNQPLGHCRGQICVVGDCPSSIQEKKRFFFLNRKLFTWGKGSTILKKKYPRGLWFNKQNRNFAF